MSKANLPNPFHSAKRIEGVSVTLTPGDLQRRMPDISTVVVAKLLETHGAIIATLMISVGIEVAMAILAEQQRMNS